MLIQPHLTQTDIDRVSRACAEYERTSLLMQQLIEELRRNPAKREEVWKQAPKPLQDMVRKTLESQRKESPIPPTQPHTNAPPNLQPFSAENPSGSADDLIRQMNRTRTSRPMSALDPRLQNHPSIRNLIRLWEKNIGPLEKTPALKQAFTDLLNSSLGNGGSDNPFDDDILNSLLNPDTPLGRELGELLDAAAKGSSLRWPDLGDWRLHLPGGNSALPTTGLVPSASSSSSESPAILSVFGLIALAALVIFLLRYRGRLSLLSKQKSLPADRLIDTHAIQGRDSLVRAFEAVSLHLFGSSAQAWTHCTIAKALILSGKPAELATSLARLYEIARYTPPHEELNPEALQTARHDFDRLYWKRA